MRKNNRNNRRKVDTGINAGATPPTCMAEHRKTPSDGLRILARIIARRGIPALSHPSTGPPLIRRQRRRDCSRLLSSAAPSPATPVSGEAARPGVSAHTTKSPEM